MDTTQTENMKEAIETYYCKEHMGVLIQAKKGGETIGYLCSEEGEELTADDVVAGMAWMFTWADLGCERDPFDHA